MKPLMAIAGSRDNSLRGDRFRFRLHLHFSNEIVKPKNLSVDFFLVRHQHITIINKSLWVELVADGMLENGTAWKNAHNRIVYPI